MDMPKGGFSGGGTVRSLARVRAAGLPAKRDEYWRYTNPSALTAAEGAGGCIVRGAD